MAILRKVKQRLQDIAGKKRRVRAPKESGVPEPKRDNHGADQMAIEKAKFLHPESTPTPGPVRIDLPYQYDTDRIILQVRDPWWLHAYWELKGSTIDRLKNELQAEFSRAKRILRVYDISHIIFDGANAHRFFDIEINASANNWYIDTAGPGRSWCVDLGLQLASGRFITIVRSNTVHTPLDGPSWITDEEWMIPDDMFAHLYGMGFGLGSSPRGKAWPERARQALFSGVLASPGITSAASPVKKPLEKKLWLSVDCELIVYGATESDAKVTIQGRPINLRKDGTFTLRFALPNGKHAIPVRVVSCDGREERTIIPIVNRETR